MLDQFNATLHLIIYQTQLNFSALLTILAIFWFIYLCTLVDKRLLYLGIVPRRWYGLPGILFAPFLHADFNHLFFNSIPLVILSNFILLNGLTYYIEATLTITLISGILTWCFAKNAIHIGASAVITGYWGLLVSSIYYQGTLLTIILGAISVYYFAGIFFGIFPSKKGVSWEGHLFGLVAGVATSYFIR